MATKIKHIFLSLNIEVGVAGVSHWFSLKETGLIKDSFRLQTPILWQHKSCNEGNYFQSWPEDPTFSMIPFTTRGFFRMCWPIPVLNTMPSKIQTFKNSLGHRKLRACLNKWDINYKYCILIGWFDLILKQQKQQIYFTLHLVKAVSYESMMKIWMLN